VSYDKGHSIKISKPIWKKLKAYCKKEGWIMSKFIDDAIVDKLDTVEPQGKPIIRRKYR